MKLSINQKTLLSVFGALLISQTLFSQLVPSTSITRLDPRLLNYGGSYYEYYGHSNVKCQLAFGWYSNQRYAHWISTRHDANTIRRNGFDFYLWQPGQSTADLGSNHVMSITGNGLALGDIYEVPSGYILKAVGNVMIEGNIECEGVEIKEIGADFVFDEMYTLPTLQEVKEYITQNKHLPGVPPAEETIKGVDIAEFNQVLLQKIEELTLYIIEQDEKIEDLQQSVQTLERQLQK